MANVVLDAMIRRADFAQQTEPATIDLFDKLRIVDLYQDGPYLKMLRKPDFQRETNHWTPDQIATFIASFAHGELIPSLIFWRSNAHIFVIDGGHRLSALRAWIENDYGDGPISNAFFGGEIPPNQKAVAKIARQKVEAKVGRFADFQKASQSDSQDEPKSTLASVIFVKAIPIQWIQGSQEVAEVSFFKINSQGTPLDKVEELLLRNRKKPYAIAARSIVRSGTGHKYWSDFDAPVQKEVESVAGEIFQLLFQPDVKEPIKTLDLPLGGTVSPVDALKMMLDVFCIVAGKAPPEKSVPQLTDDVDGATTLETLKQTRKVVRRLTGTSGPSLGLHPAVYFYNEKGKHSRFLFLGVLRVFADAVRNNNGHFFHQMTKVRSKLEAILVNKKSIINQGLANVNSSQRIDRVADLIFGLIKDLTGEQEVDNARILFHLGLKGDVAQITLLNNPVDFTDANKSAAFLKASLSQALTCPICDGYLDPTKAVSYDHDVPKKAGGDGAVENCQLTHPFCNTGVKG